MTTLTVLVMLACFMCSGFFSASETALFSLSDPTIKRWRARGDRWQKLAARLMAEQHRTLVVILVGNNFVNVLGTLLFTHLFTTWLVTGQHGAPLAALAVTAILLVFCEVTPKTLALVKSLAIAPLVAPVILGLGYALAPVVKVMQAASGVLLRLLGSGPGSTPISPPEFETFIANGERVGVFDAGEAHLLSRILRLRDCPASRVMIPRVDILSVDLAMDAETVAQFARAHRHRRLPVIDGSLDQIKGVIDTREFLSAPPVARAQWRVTMVRPALFVPLSTPLYRVLERMRREQAQLTITVDEFGGIAGLLSYEDVFEELVGEVQDEFDVPHWQVTSIGPRHWRLSGLTPLHVVEKEFHLDLEEAYSDTLGGLVAERLGRLPAPGDTVLLSHYRVEVRRVDRRRVLEVDMIGQAALAAADGKGRP